MMLRELVIDSFAGGGGASTGIRWALGRDPDIALNHDPMALAMHRINHPGTRHLEEDVVTVDARAMCAGRPIGMLWLSPDCKHHSKAKGGRPRDRNIRGLAWTVVGWVKVLPTWQRPRVLFLENVEEFADWGPLCQDGKPCPVQKGATFRAYVAAWEALGYVVEWRERRAYISGARTIRKRLYMVMRRDGEPIVWPEARFGDPASPEVRSGQLAPWGTAADCIDWHLPCPSIFDSAEEIRATHGIRAIRPLADNTLARIAKGTMRYVVQSARPFLVQLNHGGAASGRDHATDEPAPTLTSGRGEALVTLFLSHAQQGGRSRAAGEPVHTFTASRKNQDQVVTPFVTKFNRGATGLAVDEPLHTITSHASESHGGGAAPLGVVAPHLAPWPAIAPVGDPGEVDSDTWDRLPPAWRCEPPVLAGAFLAPRYQEKPGGELRTCGVDQPAATIVAGDNVPGHLAAVHLSRQFGASVGSRADTPVGTITAAGTGKAAVVAAFLAQHNRGRQPDGIQPGHSADRPLSTLTQAGSNQSLVAAHLTHAYTSNTRGGEGDPRKPLKTTLAGGQHAAAVYAFLAKYYGAGVPSQAVDEPLHTVTAKPRHGLVTVTIGGEPYVIVDIGMRMLTPRERYRAQGFPDSTIIDRGLLEDGTIVPFTLEQQGRFCGNSVCPTEAEALVAANYQEREVRAPRSRRPATARVDLFQLEAAE